jgi:hypothetical protein
VWFLPSILARAEIKAPESLYHKHIDTTYVGSPDTLDR